MDENTLKHFAYDVVKHAVDNVFLRFPNDTEAREKVYRYLSEQFQSRADFLEGKSVKSNQEN